MKYFIIVFTASFFMSSCIPAMIGAGAYHSSKTKGQRQEFMADFHKTNDERSKRGLPPLDWCSEAYRFDRKYAMTDKNCKARIRAYESGNASALEDATIIHDSNDPAIKREESRKQNKYSH